MGPTGPAMQDNASVTRISSLLSGELKVVHLNLLETQLAFDRIVGMMVWRSIVHCLFRCFLCHVGFWVFESIFSKGKLRGQQSF